MLIKKSYLFLFLFLLSLLPTALFAVASKPTDPNSGAFANTDSPVEQEQLKEIGASDQSDFLKDSTLTLHSIWYSRKRTSPDDKRILGDIDVNVLGLGLDYSSGYWANWVGVDLALNSNIKVGSSSGQSEILNYNYVNNHEVSELMFGRASLKFKWGTAKNGLKFNVGYLPIDVGTIGTAGGLHRHGYRGFEAKYTFNNFEFGYGWADQFHNEWDNTFRDMTNSYFQNRAPFQGTAARIVYIHTVGARYTFGQKKENFIDVGMGQGKDYRTNQQIAGNYTINLPAGDMFNIIAYYFQGKYNSTLSGIANPTREWHADVGGKYTHGPLTLSAGYGYSYAPDSGELNFRLTPYANSDNRNFIQTAAQLDDFVWNGEHVVKLGTNYGIGNYLGLPGLAVGISYNLGFGLVNKDANKNVIGTSRVNETDVNFTYKVDSGRLKGFGAGIYLAWLRGDRDFYGKPYRNDAKLILSYDYSLL